MRFRIELEAERIDAYSVLPCAALAQGSPSWVPAHPCTFRGRYSIGDLVLCGIHARMSELEIQEERVPQMPVRLAAYAPADPAPEPVWQRVRRVR